MVLDKFQYHGYFYFVEKAQVGVTDKQIRDYQEAVVTGQTEKARRIAGVLVQQNMGLVAKVVKKYAVKQVFLNFADAKDDLMQAGVIGILKALDTFNPARGKFSSICTWKILHEVQRELCKQMTASLPRSNRREIRSDVADLPEGFLSYDDRERIEASDELQTILQEMTLECTEEEQAYVTGLMAGLSEWESRRRSKLSEAGCAILRDKLRAAIE